VKFETTIPFAARVVMVDIDFSFVIPTHPKGGALPQGKRGNKGTAYRATSRLSHKWKPVVGMTVVAHGMIMEKYELVKGVEGFKHIFEV
jgi:hypothetical protein